MNQPTTQPRKLCAIAAEIRREWPTMGNYSPARPYVEAMGSLDHIGDKYGMDSAKDIVLRFLCNATTWRGEAARRIKAELKQIAGIK